MICLLLGFGWETGRQAIILSVMEKEGFIIEKIQSSKPIPSFSLTGHWGPVYFPPKLGKHSTSTSAEKGEVNCENFKD